MPCATKPLPLASCPDCLTPRRRDAPTCTCGYRWPLPHPLRLSAWQCQTGLAGVRRAKRTLALTRLAATLEHDAA